MAASETLSHTSDISARLHCPGCRCDLEGVDCPFCGIQLRLSGEIVHALPAMRAAHYARFIEDYEGIRAAEGRGSETEAFYLGLPYKDVAGRNSKQWKIRARSYDYVMAHLLRPSVPAGGGILDLGAGNCWMSFRLARAGFRPVAVDLLTNDHDGLGAAEHYRRHLSAIFPRVQAELSSLPFQAEQFDAAIFNASFHYAEEYESAMREALRCVRIGGMVIISDTPWYSCEESGREMVRERHAAFLQRYGTASDSISSLGYLTDERLQVLERRLSIRWEIHPPGYGLRWAFRPLAAKLRNSREPSKFRIYVARKASV